MPAKFLPAGFFLVGRRNHHAKIGILDGTVWAMGWGAATGWRLAVLLSTLFEGFEWTPTAAAGVLLAIAGNVIALRRGA